MPVSPQDFELYSRVTGNAMPSDAMSRMRMAPDVYKFTKDFARKPNLLEKTGNLVKTVGKIGLRGLGEGFRQSQANEQRAIQEQLRNQAAKSDVEQSTISESPEQVVSEPLTAGERLIDKKMKAREREAVLDQEARADKQKNAIDLLKAKASILQGSPEVLDESSTTAENYDQPVVQNQTTEGALDKKMEQGAEIATEGDTIAKVLSESEESKPSAFTDPKEVQQQMESDMVGASVTSKKVSEFLGQKGLEPLLIAAIGQREQEEKFSDHPDIIGGEDDNSLPGSQNMTVQGMSTSPTKDLSDHHKEMRKMEAMERTKNMAPSEKQVRMTNPAFDDPSHHSRAANKMEPSLFNKVPEGYEVNYGHPVFKDQDDLPSSDAYEPDDIIVPTNAARTDIQVGGMVDRKTGLGKSVGISYTPMNGNTKVGFNIMNDPTKPREVSTFDFVAPPETMESLQSQGEEDLGSKTFGKLFNMARQKKQGFSGMEM